MQSHALTLNRDWVRIFSTYSSVGIRSFRPPNGARSTFTKPFFSRTLRLPRPHERSVTAAIKAVSPDGLHHAQAHRKKLAVHPNHRELILQSAVPGLHTWNQNP
jgi:hypothetical protein